ncbi:something about silencing protein 10 isoform X1 [Formica exsecta]|uniref:something about silencing protein 10 isoform X1 n=1 Tax=Formica exsecta TaxID=72781 RepID=UPI0011445876|nr:something about silencing protein 10 isoform X1 [Formica exsecta]
MVRRKRTRKPLTEDDNEDDIEDMDIDAVTDSEEEYTETEKKLLEKVRKQRTIENFDSDDEVYGLQDESEEEEQEDDQQDSMESDIEELQEDYDMPNDRAWGNKARTFYSSDFKYTDYAVAPQKDLFNADIEEEEGKKLHLRSMEQYLDLDSVNINEVVQTIKDKKSDQKDSKQVSDKESFMFMVNNFKDCMTEAKDLLAPFLKLVENGTCPDCNAVVLLRTKYHVLLNYCINVSFFLMLKAKGLPVKMHPVTKRLIQYHKLLDQLQSKQGNLLEQVAEILHAVKEGKPLYCLSDGSQIKTSKNIPKQTSLIKNIARQKVTIIEQDKQEQLLSDSMEETDLDEEKSYDGKAIDDEKDNTTNIDPTNEEEGKRAITYQMAKNRGLTPYRKKELRNPRVKHKNKYRKALIRRKGAIREVRKELTRYDGEISGIKAGAKKSIKLKY